MLYSIYPIEEILAEDEKLEFVELDYQGKKVLFRQEGPFSFRVERIISTDPEDFLTEIYPGYLLDLRD